MGVQFEGRMLEQGAKRVPIARDRGFWTILASNAVAVAIALSQQWSLLWLLWPFWLQSVAIGAFNVRRIHKLRRFTTEGFTIDGARPEPTPETRRDTARFFAMHFGFFHAVYLVFLAVFTVVGIDGDSRSTLADAGQTGALALRDLVLTCAIGLSFLWSQFDEHRSQVALDATGTPNIGTLMFLPYARIVPMHLMIIGGMVIAPDAGVAIFGTLKTAADLVMHRIELRMKR